MHETLGMSLIRILHESIYLRQYTIIIMPIGLGILIAYDLDMIPIPDIVTK